MILLRCNRNPRLRRIPTPTELERRREVWARALIAASVVGYVVFVASKIWGWW